MAEPRHKQVHMHGFTVATERLLISLANNIQPPPRGDDGFYLPVGSALHLVNVLKDRPDAGFPGGKWATIQHAEACISEGCV